MRWFHAILPKEEKFIELFIAHARTLDKGSEALRRMLEGGPGMAQAVKDIWQHEDEADAIVREAMQTVRRSFITPFDRSDIQALVVSLDDAIDQMKKTAKAADMFEVTEFQPQMREMGDIIVQCAALTVEAMGLMAKPAANSTRLHALSEQITHLEEQADGFCDAGLKALYLNGRKGDAMAYIVGAEIYDHLEKVVDRFEDVANQISGIVVENL